MDGIKLLSSFQYATISNYLPLPAGSHNIEIALIGKGVDAPVIMQTVPVSTGKAYTVAALGMQSTKSLSLEVFDDNNSILGNTAKVRIYHLSPGTGALDATENMHEVIHSISYLQASDYIFIPAGPHTFNVSTPPAKAPVAVSAVIKPWTVTSIFAIGLLNSDPHLRFVTTQVTGVPGLPQTGSAPIAQPKSSQIFIFVGVAVLASLLIIVASRNYYRARELVNAKNQ